MSSPPLCTWARAWPMCVAWKNATRPCKVFRASAYAEAGARLHPRQIARRFVDHLVHLRQALLHHLLFLLRKRPVLRVHGFPNARQRLHSVAGVKARRIDLVLVPRAVREP